MAMLKEHKNKSHPSKDGPKFPCSVCSRIYNTKTQLSNHIKNTHEQRDRSVYCEFCGFKAKGPHYLKLHILRKHQPKEFEKAKKHDCSYCGKKFFTIFEVNQHVLTHTGERPFVCHICQKGFTQKHCLNGHMKSVNFLSSVTNYLQLSNILLILIIIVYFVAQEGWNIFPECCDK